MSESLARSRVSAPLPASAGAVSRVRSTGLLAFVIIMCLGPWFGGLLGLVAGIVASLGLAYATVRSPGFRRLLDCHQQARERRRRDLQRERRLERAGPLRRAEFAELYGLVSEIERREPDQAERFELQDLLDHYIGLAVSLQNLVEAVQRSDRAPLWQSGVARAGTELGAGAPGRHRQDILTRRLEHRDRCRKRAGLLADELDAVAEFIHLVSEMTSCPGLDEESDRELERRLWELEAQETALRQLSAA